MDDWHSSEKDWENFISTTTSQISDHLWPKFNKDTVDWSGDAADQCVDATEKEIEIMIEEFQKYKKTNDGFSSILQEIPNTGSEPGDHYNFDHMFHFQAEDSIRKEIGKHSGEEIFASHTQGANFISYCPDIDVSTFHNQFYGDRGRKLKGLFDYKDTFQRPRPYQTAMIFGRPEFVTHIGKRGVHTGVTPSLISGHCLQGILLSCKVLEIWINNGASNNDCKDKLAQYAVDYGDRRVFAGVHYPIDNISSWIIALQIIPHIYKHHEEILEFAKGAITEKSYVYEVIKKRYGQENELQKSVEFLNLVIASPADQLRTSISDA